MSPLHGLIVANLSINKIYTKVDKVKIKSYLHIKFNLYNQI